MADKEIWKDIEGYEGLYQVSNKGRVKSLARKNNRRVIVKDFMLKIHVHHTGYAYIRVSKNYVKQTLSIHRLVCKAFIPNPENKPCINHKDENPLNNTVENLEWVTQKENANYGTRNARVALKNGKRIIQCDLNGNEIKRWNSLAEASRFYGVTYPSISEVCRGIKPTACGYKWKYEMV